MTAKDNIDNIKDCAIALKVRQSDGMFVAIALKVCVVKQKDSLLTTKERLVTIKERQQTGEVELGTTKV